MADAIFPQIMGASTAKEACDTLQEEFQETVKVHTVKLQKLRRDFENLKMKDNETAKDYYSRIKEIVNKIGAYGEIIYDKKIVEKILISCTEKYDAIISVIEETKDIDTLSPTELIGSLEAYESRREKHSENSTENAFQSKINSQSKKFKADGRKSQENLKNKNHLEKQNNDKYPPCEEKDTWYLDGGCSDHMTKNESIFCSLDKSKTKVKIGNGDFMEAVGKGTIVTDTKKCKR
ncbi:uncharacterized protein LOC133791932 [Humulus lupulus]|uniref:uncharacterized protein LOC133791932 n=1 Tax=Humulus lupulus TaxID=3486 RepID=UPI002B41712E|nr:uncharacterized protein LOC133791932 [Humulus lupulus]